MPTETQTNQQTAIVQESNDDRPSLPAKAKGQRGPKRPWYDPDIKEEMFENILERMVNGESLVHICETRAEYWPNETYPSIAAFYSWIYANPKYKARYDEAMKMRSDSMLESIIHISDTEPNPAIARNKIDARKWHNEKMSPKRYGVKVLAESNVNMNHKVDLALVPAHVREELRAALLKQLGAPTIDGEATEDESIE
jgi:hypothetical protein